MKNSFLKTIFVCLLGAMSVAPQFAAADATAGAPFSLNVKDADIQTLIATVADATGKTFIVDPRVTGKVTVINSTPQSKEELYKLFLQILRVNGFAAVAAGKSIRIVPEQVALQDGSAGMGEGADSIVTRVIELKHLSPAEVLPVLQQMISQTTKVLPHGPSNSLVLAGRGSDVERIVQIVRRLDVSSQSDVELIPLAHANAMEVVRTINQLNPSAPDSNGRLVADERTNGILLGGEKSRRLKLRALIASLDTPLVGSDTTTVIRLRYSSAKDMVPLLQNLLKGQIAEVSGAPSGGVNTASAGAPNKDGSTIQAHVETNSLVITAPAAVIRTVEQVVRQLDVRRAQVQIEALIAEVSDGTAKDLGIQWQATDENFNGGRGLIGGTNFPGAGNQGSILGATLNPIAALAASSGLNLGYVVGTTRIPGTDKDIPILGALAKLLAADSRSNVVSHPSTMCLDHEEANLSVGQEVPFLTGQYGTVNSTSATGATPGGGTGTGLVNPFQTIERKEVGLKLKVTPHINEGDAVILDLDLEVSSLAPNVQGAQDLVTNSRKLRTRVMVRDGGVLVLGGLSSDELTQSIQRVPGLSKIPLLGNLFKSRSNTKQRRQLLVFIKPTIARDYAMEDAISSDKYNFIRAEQMKAREQSGALIKDADVPVIPALEDFLREPTVVKPVDEQPKKDGQ
jgi:general secretion pathway protein D